MNTTQQPLTVGEIVGERASMLMPGDVITKFPYAQETVIMVGNGHVVTSWFDEDGLINRTVYTLEMLNNRRHSKTPCKIVSLVPRAPVINYDDAGPLTRELAEEYGFSEYSDCPWAMSTAYMSDPTKKPLLIVTIPDGRVLIRGSCLCTCNAGQFRALMKALGIEPKGSE